MCNYWSPECALISSSTLHCDFGGARRGWKLEVASEHRDWKLCRLRLFKNWPLAGDSEATFQPEKVEETDRSHSHWQCQEMGTLPTSACSGPSHGTQLELHCTGKNLPLPAVPVAKSLACQCLLESRACAPAPAAACSSHCAARTGRPELPSH